MKSSEQLAYQVETGSPEQRIASTHYIELVASGDHWQVVTPAQQIKLCHLVYDTIGLLPEDKCSTAEAAALMRASDWIKHHHALEIEHNTHQQARTADQTPCHKRTLLSQRYPSAETVELDRMLLRLTRRQVQSSVDLDLIANQAMNGKLSAEREGTRLFINAILGDRY